MGNDTIIYHGSYIPVEYPEIRTHRFTKDFSWGFYCTEIKKQAEKWAGRYDTPIVSIYKLRNIDGLNIKVFDGYTDEWLDFVVECRSGKTHSYDIVIGAMADDTIYEYLDGYRAGKMNKERFFKLMKFKYPTHQISFHTITALECVKFIDSYEVEITDEE